jgi:hypothetical protein
MRSGFPSGRYDASDTRDRGTGHRGPAGIAPAGATLHYRADRYGGGSGPPSRQIAGIALPTGGVYGLFRRRLAALAPIVS